MSIYRRAHLDADALLWCAACILCGTEVGGSHVALGRGLRPVSTLWKLEGAGGTRLITARLGAGQVRVASRLSSLAGRVSVANSKGLLCMYERQKPLSKAQSSCLPLSTHCPSLFATAVFAAPAKFGPLRRMRLLSLREGGWRLDCAAPALLCSALLLLQSFP